MATTLTRQTVPVGGVVRSARNRETGTTTTVERTGPGSWIEQEPGWMTTCEDHSTCCLHYTRQRAMAHAAVPSGWCAECSTIAEAVQQ